LVTIDTFLSVPGTYFLKVLIDPLLSLNLVALMRSMTVGCSMTGMCWRRHAWQLNITTLDGDEETLWQDKRNLMVGVSREAKKSLLLTHL
jgi:hypothetical protein